MGHRRRRSVRIVHRETMIRMSIVAACATVALGVFGVAGAAATPMFGLADDWLPQYGSAGQTDNAAFTTLRANLPLTGIRLAIPWNALGENHHSGSTTTCEPDNVPDTVDYIHPYKGVSMSSAIRNFLAVAAADGLSVTVDFGKTADDGSGHMPAFNASEYMCGVEQFVEQTDAWGESVHTWEPMNEPAGFKPTDTGAAAAAIYVDLYYAVRDAGAADGVDHTGDGYAAGVFGTSTPASFVSAYIAKLKSEGVEPPAWSIHPYVDFTSWLQGDGNFRS